MCVTRSSLRLIGENHRRNGPFRIFDGILMCYTEYGFFVSVSSPDKIIVSVHMVFNEVIPDPTDEDFAEHERLNIDVASESRNPADYQFISSLVCSTDGMASSMRQRVWQSTRALLWCILSW